MGREDPTSLRPAIGAWYSLSRKHHHPRARSTLSAKTLPTFVLILLAAVALQARQSGAQPATKVLSKPFHLRDLVDEVDRILAA